MKGTIVLGRTCEGRSPDNGERMRVLRNRILIYIALTFGLLSILGGFLGASSQRVDLCPYCRSRRYTRTVFGVCVYWRTPPHEFAGWYESTHPQHKHAWLPMGEQRDYILFSVGRGAGMSPYIYPLFLVSEKEQKEFLERASAAETALFHADLVTNQACAVDLILSKRTPPTSVEGLLSERLRHGRL